MYSILVVDDESRIRTIIRKYAPSLKDIKVTEAADAVWRRCFAAARRIRHCDNGHYDAGA